MNFLNVCNFTSWNGEVRTPLCMFRWHIRESDGIQRLQQLWKIGEEQRWEDVPIVWFGEEGGKP